MGDSRDARDQWVERVLGFRIGTGSPERDALQARLDRLEADYQRVMRLDPPERTRLSALMQSSIEHLQSTDLARAGSALARLETLVEAGGVAKPVVQTTTQSLADVASDPQQLVACRTALLQWEAARKDAHAQLARLKSTIAGQAPAVAAAAAVLDRVMDRLNDDLSEAIDDTINAKDDGARTDAHERAAALARNYLVRVNFDPVFSLVDENPVTPLTLRSALGGSLKELVAALPA